jgi:hypothetical protein
LVTLLQCPPHARPARRQRDDQIAAHADRDAVEGLEVVPTVQAGRIRRRSVDDRRIRARLAERRDRSGGRRRIILGRDADVAYFTLPVLISCSSGGQR